MSAVISFLVSAIGLGMTLLYGSTGETLTEKSGHLNLGIPGVMCVGASCGCFAEYLTCRRQDLMQTIFLPFSFLL